MQFLGKCSDTDTGTSRFANNHLNGNCTDINSAIDLKITISGSDVQF